MTYMIGNVSSWVMLHYIQIINIIDNLQIQIEIMYFFFKDIYYTSIIMIIMIIIIKNIHIITIIINIRSKWVKKTPVVC